MVFSFFTIIFFSYVGCIVCLGREDTIVVMISAVGRRVVALIDGERVKLIMGKVGHYCINQVRTGLELGSGDWMGWGIGE